MAYKKADAVVAIDVDGTLYSLSKNIAELSPQLEANLDTKDVYDTDFPLVSVTGYSGEVTISGLIASDDTKGMYKQEVVDRDQVATFCIIHKEGKLVGPVGDMLLQNRNIVDSDGIFVIEGKSVAVPSAILPIWEFGNLAPADFNTNRAQGTNGWPDAVEGQKAVIVVIAPDGMTDLNIQLVAGADTYELAAKKTGASVVAGMTVGELKDGTTVVPASALSSGQWHLEVSGTRTNAEFYVGLLAEL